MHTVLEQRGQQVVLRPAVTRLGCVRNKILKVSYERTPDGLPRVGALASGVLMERREHEQYWNIWNVVILLKTHK